MVCTWNFAGYYQLPSTEAVSVFIYTRSVSLSIVLHLALYYKCLFTFIWPTCRLRKTEPSWQKGYLTALMRTPAQFTLLL